MLAEVKKKNIQLSASYIKRSKRTNFYKIFFLTKNQFSFLEGMRNL